MARKIPDLPGEPLVDRGGSIRKSWIDWLVGTIGALFVSSVTQIAETVALDDRTASIGATAFGTGSLLSGRYLVTLYLRVTTPAGATSSLQGHIYWTDPTDGQVLIYNSAVLTGNVVTAVIQVALPIDAGVSVSYGTTYASTGAPAMVYKVTATILELPR